MGDADRAAKTALCSIFILSATPYLCAAHVHAGDIC